MDAELRRKRTDYCPHGHCACGGELFYHDEEKHYYCFDCGKLYDKPRVG